MKRDKEQFEVTIEIWKEQLSDGTDIYVSRIRELDIASQGSTVEEAQDMAKEALMLWLETATPTEIEHSILPLIHRQRTSISRARVEFAHGQAQNFVWA